MVVKERPYFLRLHVCQILVYFSNGSTLGLDVASVAQLAQHVRRRDKDDGSILVAMIMKCCERLLSEAILPLLMIVR